MANQKPETVDCDSMLYEALRIARIPDRLALNAYKEVQEVAGLNINNRLDTFENTLNSNTSTSRWFISIFIGLFVALSSVVAVIAGFVGYLLTR